MESDMMQILLIDSNSAVLRSFSEKSSDNALEYLEELGVSVNLGMRVTGGDVECHHIR